MAAQPASASAAAAASLARLRADIAAADIVRSDPALLDQAPVAEGQRALAARRRGDRAAAERNAEADADAAAAAATRAADADGRPALVDRRAFGHPGVHLGAVGELAAARGRTPGARDLVVGR